MISGTSLNGIVIKANLGQWHPVEFFFKRMIPTKTWYKTYNGELLAFVEAFKTQHHYLKSYKHEVFILTNYNNLRCFMDTKSLSSRQAC